MATQIFEHNIPELQCMYSKGPSNEGQGILTKLISTRRADLGSFNVSSMAVGEMHLMDVNWNVPNQLVIHESNPSQTIDINFVLNGCIHGIYRGLKTEFELKSGTNNLKFTPDERSAHRASKQDVGLFALAVEKKYFQALIGYDNAWADDVQRKMNDGVNFFGSKKFLNTTPRMQAVVHAIRTMKSTPMSRIMTQSLVLELIALQVEQLSALNGVKFGVDILLPNDIDKLHKAKDFIERNFLEELTLTQVCREVMLNEFKLKKGFKSLFQTGVIQYVRQLRMELAQNLLRDNRMTVEEVASRLGYRYPNHFSAAYKKYFGVVPSERKALPT